MIWKVMAYAVSATSTTSYCCIIFDQNMGYPTDVPYLKRIFMSQLSVNFNLNNFFALMSSEDHNLYICSLFFVNPVLKNIDRYVIPSDKEITFSCAFICIGVIM
ncbi:unnamed protein product [Musa textilis]